MRWLVLFALTGCDPTWSVDVTVTDPAGSPIATAALVLTGCPRQNDHDLGTVAALTDVHGDADVAGSGFDYPTCDVTVAKPGFMTWQMSFEELCAGHRDDCGPLHRDIVLEPAP